MPNHLLKTERQHKILQLVEQNEHVTVAGLCQSFNVSEATVRRDLEELSQKGHVRRAHGGALRTEPAPPELPVLQRAAEHSLEKHRIGLATAELIQEDETLFIGSGTTTAQVARALVGKRRVTVLTNALNVAIELAGDPAITVVVVGGVLRRSELSAIGHIAEQHVHELRTDRVIMGAHALDPGYGLSSEYLPEVMTDRALMKLGSQLVIVADHSKFGRVSTALLAPIQAIHTVITDKLAPAAMVQALEDGGVRVILA